MKKLGKRFGQMMEATAFAEVGESQTAREIMAGPAETGAAGHDPATVVSAQSPAGAIQVQDQRLQTLSESHDRNMEAVAFAEANEHAHAREILREEEREKKKILVVASEEGYSDQLIHYALGMADRMHYEVIALNVVPVGNRLFKFLAENVKEELQSRAEAQVAGFAALAAERNIPFTHVVRFGDTDKSIHEVHKEKKRVCFVLAEPESVCEGNVCKPSIPVFCLANH